MLQPSLIFLLPHRVQGHCYCLQFPTCWCIALRACNSSLLYHCCSVCVGVTLGRHSAFPCSEVQKQLRFSCNYLAPNCCSCVLFLWPLLVAFCDYIVCVCLCFRVLSVNVCFQVCVPYECIQMCLFVCVCLCLSACACGCPGACVHVFVCMYVCVCMWVNGCTCVYMWLCVSSQNLYHRSFASTNVITIVDNHQKHLHIGIGYMKTTYNIGSYFVLISFCLNIL